MNHRKGSSYLFYIGYLHYTYVHAPLKSLWLKWKYRKLSREVRRRYLK